MMERLLMAILGGTAAATGNAAERLFPTDLPSREWVSFRASGYARPVWGVIYRLEDPVTNGMALGGIDTGCIDLETNGTFGYSTIFNTHVPRGGASLRPPVLALNVGGETWVLAGDRESDSLPLSHVEAWLPGDLGPAQPAWAASATDIPGWAKSVGTSPHDLPQGRVFCHDPAAVCWTSPLRGKVRISGGLWTVRNLGRVQKWELRKNGRPFTEGLIAWGPTSAAPQSFAMGSGGEAALTLPVEVGDVLELRLDQAVGNDFVGVDLRITGAGRTWDLADDWSDTPNPQGPWSYERLGHTAYVFRAGRFPAVRRARQIHYWGHYPIADLEFDTDAPVEVGLRAWSPFLPGDVVASMLPGIVFEVHLRNASGETQQGTLAFSFPGPTSGEAGTSQFTRQKVEGDFTGVAVSGPLAAYALGVVGNQPVRLGGELGAHGPAWARIATALPEADPHQGGASVAVEFALKAGESRVVRFLLTWCAPTWKGGGYNAAPTGNTFTHRYARFYPDPVQTAQRLAREHESLRQRVLAWQSVIYAEESLPGWLRDSLINVLYLITEDGYWAQKQPPLPDWVREEDGLFGMNECPRGCPQIECIPCSFYGSLPLTYFFPELQLSTIRGYQGYQYPDGAPPWIFGGVTGGTPPIDFACPTRGYQFATNGISLAAIVDRFLLCCDGPERTLTREFYPMIKRAMIWTVNLRTTPTYTLGQRILAMPDGNVGTEWFEAPEPGWAGMTAHLGGLHLAQLRITERLAQAVGDADFARQCAEWIRAGAEAMERWLWDERGYYLNYLEPETGKKSELVFGYQLDGEWITDHHGLPSALPEERVKAALETIRRCNVAVSRYGAVNYANPDGTVANPGGYGAFSYFPPEALMLAMNFMYEGQPEFGMELARRVWHNLVCRQGYTWDLPNIMRGDLDTGERTFGNDYYQDLMLWSLPAAWAGQTVEAPTRPGGLVDRILRAARGG
jgi:uncharacterized protein (DUF608 family)